MDEQKLLPAVATSTPTILLSIAWAIAGYWLAPRLAHGRRLWVVLCLTPMIYFLTITMFALLIVNAIINRPAVPVRMPVKPAEPVAS